MRFFILCFLLAIAIIASVVTFVYKAPEVEFTEERYIVQSGDSLWYISTKYCPDSMDMQMYIQMLKDRNNLSDAIIYPGQSLIVLVEAS